METAAGTAFIAVEAAATAAQTLARGTTGSAKAFKELGITLDSNLPKNEAIAKAFDQLNQKRKLNRVQYQVHSGWLMVLHRVFNI